MPPDTTSHIRGICQCVRCTGFQPGHKYSAGENHRGGPPVKHGLALSPLKLMPAAQTIADLVRPNMPIQGEAFEGTLQGYCIILARLQLAHDYLERMDAKKADGTFDPEKDGDPDYVEVRVQRLEKNARAGARDLGLTPQSAAQILRDIKGGDRNPFRPPSQQELGAVSKEKLRELRDAFTAALEPDDYIDAEAV